MSDTNTYTTTLFNRDNLPSYSKNYKAPFKSGRVVGRQFLDLGNLSKQELIRKLYRVAEELRDTNQQLKKVTDPTTGKLIKEKNIAPDKLVHTSILVTWTTNIDRGTIDDDVAEVCAGILEDGCKKFCLFVKDRKNAQGVKEPVYPEEVKISGFVPESTKKSNKFHIHIAFDVKAYGTYIHVEMNSLRDQINKAVAFLVSQGYKDVPNRFHMKERVASDAQDYAEKEQKIPVMDRAGDTVVVDDDTDEDTDHEKDADFQVVLQKRKRMSRRLVKNKKNKKNPDNN